MNNAKGIDTAVNHHWDAKKKKKKKRSILSRFHALFRLADPKHSMPLTSRKHTHTHTNTECSDGIMTECVPKGNSRGWIAAASVACICENLSAFAWVYRGKRTPVMHTNVRVQSVCFSLPFCLPLFSVPFTLRHTRLG